MIFQKWNFVLVEFGMVLTTQTYIIFPTLTFCSMSMYNSMKITFFFPLFRQVFILSHFLMEWNEDEIPCYLQLHFWSRQVQNFYEIFYSRKISAESSYSGLTNQASGKTFYWFILWFVKAVLSNAQTGKSFQFAKYSSLGFNFMLGCHIVAEYVIMGLTIIMFDQCNPSGLSSQVFPNVFIQQQKAP